MHNNRSMPTSAIIPELPYSDVREAADWLCRAFGFSERLRIGTHRAQLTFGSGSIVVTQGNASTTACAIMVRVDDVDSHYAHARQAGVPIINPPTDYPYGERQYTAQDLGGHRWTFSQTIADVDPATWGGVLLA
ncbi:MAG: VOC family protein [Anaerolineaceae bacterium]|nr:VOC family protein [Anaerolineaceae bacterium]